MCDAHEIDQPQWLNLTSIEAAFDFADKVGYPVLVRPSYVLSGAAMNVAYSAGELAKHLAEAEEVSADKPVVITEFIEGGREIDVDAVADNGEVIAHAISEHVENAGIHSGDATLMLPTQTIPLEEMKLVRETIRKIGKQWWWPSFPSTVYTSTVYTSTVYTSTVQTRYTHGTHTSMAHI